MLRPGARIAVVSSSGNFDPALLDAGVNIARSWGYELDLLPGVGRRHRYLAGTDQERLRDLSRALRGGWDAVWLARGGYGINRLLPSLPWDELAGVPMIGFSDATGLLNALAARGHPAVHGPVLHSLARSDAASQERLRVLLQGEPAAALVGTPIRRGDAQGPLVGGNLCVLASLCGTPWQLRGHACIVVLEEINEVPYKVDRLVTQLIDAGCLDGVAGVALGSFLGAPVPEGEPWTMEEVLHDLLAPLGVPVLAGLPIGHGAHNHAFRLGTAARIRGNTLELDA